MNLDISSLMRIDIMDDFDVLQDYLFDNHNYLDSIYGYR